MLLGPSTFNAVFYLIDQSFKNAVSFVAQVMCNRHDQAMAGVNLARIVAQGTCSWIAQ